MSRDPRADVLIAGGGVAGLEALLALRAHAGEPVRIKLLAPEPDFVLRASAVLEPFSRGRARRFQLRQITEAHGARLVQDGLAAVHPERHAVTTTSGTELSYGTLLVALGAVRRPPFPGATTFLGHGGHEALDAVLRQAVAGDFSSLAFVIPPGATWALPLYELALLTRAHLDEHGAPPLALTVVTPEERPLEIFGSAAGDELEAVLTERGIALRTLSRVRELADGQLLLEGGSSLEADRAIALPALEGPAVPGLPADDLGFLPADEYGRLAGVEDVYAAGDCTSFPLKQGGLAAQQADAAAAAIAVAIGAEAQAEPFRPVLRGLLLTGAGARYFRSEPGSGNEPSTVAIDAPAQAGRAGASGVAAHRPLWWPPSKVAGRYLGAWLANPRLPGSEVIGLEDREVEPPDEHADEERRAAMELALLMAQAEARYGDWRAALRALDAAEVLSGALPEEWAQRREAWRAELEGRPSARFAGG